MLHDNKHKRIYPQLKDSRASLTHTIPKQRMEELGYYYMLMTYLQLQERASSSSLSTNKWEQNKE